MSSVDAIVVGAGPNGLAAAITLAEAGWSVQVIEARTTIGGGCRTDELTLPGFRHDVCSAIHPLGLASPFFRRLDLARHGLEFLQPGVPLAHPLPGRAAAVVERSLVETAAGLGGDGAGYKRLLGRLVRHNSTLLEETLGPLRPPRHPLLLAGFARDGLLPASLLARRFGGDRARALLAGAASHSMLPLSAPLTSAYALMLLSVGHAVGWPVARNGSQAIVEALGRRLLELGGTIETGRTVRRLEELPPARAYLFDVVPRDLVRICGSALTPGYVKRLQRFRHGPGVFKIDYALDGPIPWTDAACLRAGTVHVGGRLEEIAVAEAAVGAGRIPDRPFLILAQQSLVDPGRAPAGRHTVWLYCHVPNGSDVDMTDRIERQLERFAPGFRDRVLGRRITDPRALEIYNANNIGGDINGGLEDWRQLFTRPGFRISPYTTPNPKLYICSSSTPPGGGVHGMCGHHAARAALSRAGAVA